MAFTFVNGSVPTAAQMNQAIGPMMLTGKLKITPVANQVTEKAVVYPAPFLVTPTVILTPASTVAGGTLKGWTVAAGKSGPSGFTAAIYRTNTVNTYLHWLALLPPVSFVAGQVAAASLLNQGAGGMVAQSGVVSITPSGSGDPTSATVTFPDPFASTPLVYTTALATVPDLILGTGATSPTAEGVKIWLTRGSTTATTVQWVAVGRM